MLRKTGDSGNAGIASQADMAGIAGDRQYFTKSRCRQTGIGLECPFFLIPRHSPYRMEDGGRGKDGIAKYECLSAIPKDRDLIRRFI